MLVKGRSVSQAVAVRVLKLPNCGYFVEILLFCTKISQSCMRVCMYVIIVVMLLLLLSLKNPEQLRVLTEIDGGDGASSSSTNKSKEWMRLMSLFMQLRKVLIYLTGCQ